MSNPNVIAFVDCWRWSIICFWPLSSEEPKGDSSSTSLFPFWSCASTISGSTGHGSRWGKRNVSLTTFTVVGESASSHEEDQSSGHRGSGETCNRGSFACCTGFALHIDKVDARNTGRTMKTRNCWELLTSSPDVPLTLVIIASELISEFEPFGLFWTAALNALAILVLSVCWRHGSAIVVAINAANSWLGRPYSDQLSSTWADDNIALGGCFRGGWPVLVGP